MWRPINRTEAEAAEGDGETLELRSIRRRTSYELAVRAEARGDSASQEEAAGLFRLLKTLE